MCIHEGCRTRPIFNKEGEKAMYCSTHKEADMVDVVHERCMKCKKRPNFNKEGEKALYCAQHKEEGMIDVSHDRCIHAGCKKRPNFNTEGKKALYCLDHKQEVMIDVSHDRCIHPGCKTRPTYNKEGEKAMYCMDHKLTDMIDVKHDMCKSEWCTTRVQEKYDGYCLHCYMHLFPDKPVSRNYKTKEYAVVDYVKTKFPYPWISDKRIQGGSSKRRPDLMLDLSDQLIIVEVDEKQHSDYNCSCENKRIMELSQDLGHRPIVFIRFNPDEYQSGTMVRSCWGINKKGICVVRQSKKEEWAQRLHALGEMIEYWLKYRTDKTIEIIQLFYS
jgi:plastocyanin